MATDVLPPKRHICSVCGGEYCRGSIYTHIRVPHYRCCDKVWFGKPWIKHRKETGHVGVTIVHDAVAERTCKFGCGTTPNQDTWDRHEASPHYRCVECGTVVLQRLRNNHTIRTGHGTFNPLQDPGLQPHPSAPPQAAACKSETKGVSDSKNPPTSLQGPQPPPANSDLPKGPLELLLNEVRQLYPQLRSSKETRWKNNLKTIMSIFPDSNNLPYANIWTPSSPCTTSPEEADVWRLTDEEMVKLAETKQPFTKPIIIRLRDRIPPHDTMIQNFVRALERHFKGGKLDVQDFSQEDLGPIQMTIPQIKNRILGPPRDISNKSPPINLLNLRGGLLGHTMPAPEFLNSPRFDLISVLNARLESQSDGVVNPGKRAHMAKLQGREIDLASCRSFTLFAQRGSWTGFHMDVGDGTWVYNDVGTKAWVFPAGPLESELEHFRAAGDAWIPKNGVRFVILRAGDSLIMPPGPKIPHSVLTLEDCVMHGGMFFDEKCIFETLENILWMAKNPLTTNEAIPRQLIAGWPILRELILGASSLEDSEATRTRFDDVTSRMRDALSCTCSGGCTTGCKETMCKCKLSLAQDFRCTVWCHGSKKKKIRA